MSLIYSKLVFVYDVCVCVCVYMYSVVSDSLQSQDFQSPLSMEFSRQEYWSWLLCPIPWDLPDLGIEPMSPALQADSLPLSHWGKCLFTM